MELKSKFIEIKQFLSISNDNKELEQCLSKYHFSDYTTDQILDIILKFVNYFSMFKELTPFMNSVYNCINNTLDSFNIDSLHDFEDLFIKNALLHFIQEYLNHANISQKAQVLNVLADSLEKLQAQPLIINLGLMLKPMYQDQDYLNKRQLLEEVEVEYILNAKDEMEIKQQIDQWLNVQNFDINDQIELERGLMEEFDRIISDFKVSRESEKYKNLLKEAMEMLALKLTFLSLMEVDDSVDPMRIK